MVFNRAFESLRSPGIASGNPSEGIKASGAHLSLNDLIGPRRNQSSAAVNNLLKDACIDFDFRDLSTASSTSGTGSPVIVATQHHQLRTIRHQGRTTSNVPRTDNSNREQLRLPRFDEKFSVPEYSDRLDGSKSTVVVTQEESCRDSASVARCTPFLAGALFRESMHEVTKLPEFKPSQAKALPPKSSSSSATHAKSIMSSPQNPSSPSSPTLQSRPRSRSIAIKNPRPSSGYYPGTSASQLELVAAEEDSVSNERMYDWATWRMYNRIVDHRRSQCISSSSQQQAAGTSRSSIATDPPVYSFGGAMNVPLDSISPTNYVYDEEVFELDI